MRVTTSALRIDWRFAVGQVVLTALGVILGLAANAWWGEHMDRVREDSTLHAALAAARTNEQRLLQAIYEDSLAHALNVRVLNDVDRIPPDSLRTIMYWGTWTSDVRPLTMPFQAMFTTGDINVVRDDALRSQIAQYIEEIGARTRIIEDHIAHSRAATARDLPLYAYQEHPIPAPKLARRLHTDNAVRKVLVIRTGDGSASVDAEQTMLHFTSALRTALERKLHESPVHYPPPRLLRDSI